MKLDRRLLLATLLPGLVLVIWMGLALALLRATLEAAEWAMLAAMLESRAALVLLLGLVLAGGLGYGASRLYRDRVEAPARLLEETQILLAGDVHRELGAQGSAENRGLTRAINELVAQREQLRRDVEARVREASHHIEQEKSRLPRSCPSSRKAWWSAAWTVASSSTTTVRACSSVPCRRPPPWRVGPS